VEVKGTAVKAVTEYVQSRHKDKYDKWLASLSPESAAIMKNVLAGNWYPISKAIVEPTQEVC
jgi:hypothetical protein